MTHAIPRRPQDRPTLSTPDHRNDGPRNDGHRNDRPTAVGRWSGHGRRSSRRSLTTLAVTLALAGVLGSHPAAALPTPQDDVLLAVAGVERTVRRGELTVNDGIGLQNFLVLGFEIVDPPDGTISGGHPQLGLTYTAPEIDSESIDTFTYRLVHGTTVSETATVTVRISPRLVPLSGRWRTLHPAGSACIEDAGEELGWYDAANATFYLCDLELEHERLRNCQTLPVPSQGVGETPLVGDWDNDGLDDLALHNPVLGKVRFFEVDHGPGCPGFGSQGALIHLDTLDYEGPMLQAIAGRWTEGAAASVGFFDPETESFDLLQSNGSPTLLATDTTLIAPSSQGDPMAVVQAIRRVGADGIHRVGYYQRLLQVLRTLEVSGVASLDPQGDADLVFKLTSQPVLGRWPLDNTLSDMDYWAGFFETASPNSPYLAKVYLLRDWNAHLPDDDDRMPRHVQVVVDPPGSQ